MSYYGDLEDCCESIDCEEECVCDSLHHGCGVCESRCDCVCDEMYEAWKDSQLD